ncbi:MAG: threonine synthase [Thermosediminibacterales bacterium]|nr:threonine synthase [Thermosediminibacterales bacterium]
MKSYIKHLECSKCNSTFNPDKAMQLCPICSSPLLVRYDLIEVKNNLKKEEVKKRKPDLWRYFELLPVKNENNKVSLGEGMTPIVELLKAGKEIGLNSLYIKDESILPTGTFKARGAAVGVSKAKELGIKTLAMPTNGNAGAAWSMYSARAGIKCFIVMPEDAPYITKCECAAAGVNFYIIKGLINDAGRIVSDAINQYGWFDVSTLKEPYRIEGKKTMGFEIAEQFNWEIPDVIIYPTGGGVGIIGIYKALKELQEIGWIGKKMPKLIAVQAEGCAPIVKAFKEGRRESDFWNNSFTVAFGINVPKALGDFLVLKCIYETEGCAITVSDKDILLSQKEIALKEGLFICPEGAATYAAARKLKKQGFLKSKDKVVLLNTGTGLKYPNITDIDAKILGKNDKITLQDFSLQKTQ